MSIVEPTENWRDIPGYEGRYMVSDQGRVRSLRRVDIMQQFTDRDGYLRVTLTKENSRQRCEQVHQLMLWAFVGPKAPGAVTRHRNGVRTDNRLTNLCYGTPKENTADRETHGTHQRGARNPNVKLTPEDIAYIRAQPYARGLYTKLAERFNVSRVQISFIVKKKSWAHLQ
jgi:hypothetical protein